MDDPLSPRAAFFPDYRIYEYYLQRLRLVSSQRIQVLKVHDIHDVPETETGRDLPAIDVVLRVRGLKVLNPATGGPLIRTDWIEDLFNSSESQQRFLDAFAQYLGDSIPEGHPEAHLKPKFREYRSGSPGDLPARGDLHMEREELIRHLVAAKTWLRRIKRAGDGYTRKDCAEFLEAISAPIFWWAEYVRGGQITLEQIFRHSPRTSSMEILALKYRKSVEAIKRRFRPEK